MKPLKKMKTKMKTMKKMKKIKPMEPMKTNGIKNNYNGNEIYTPSIRNHSFNNNKFIRESHNCYTYFLNLKSLKAYQQCKKDLGKYNYCDRPQPGRRAGYQSFKKEDFNCNEVMKRTGADNPKMITLKNIKKTCPDGFYKGAVVVAPGRDYHYYRLNKEGYWTHKPGYKPSTAYDAKGKIITDPKMASRDYSGTLNYSDFCGYTCLPNNPELKNMSMIPNNKKNILNRITQKFKNKEVNIMPNISPYVNNNNQNTKDK